MKNHDSRSSSISHKQLNPPGASAKSTARFGWAVLTAAALACSATFTSAAEVPLGFPNLGMEEGTSTPQAWQQGAEVEGVEQSWDRQNAHTGKASLHLKKTAQRYFPIAQWHQVIAVTPQDAERQIRVRCWVKAQGLTKGIVDINYQGAEQRGHTWAVFLGQKEKSDPVLTHDWKLYEATVKVPAKVSKVGVGLQIYGPGEVWFDDLDVAWAS